MTTWHIYMSIAAAERMSDYQLEDAFSGTAAEIRTSLAIMKANGMEVIPSKGCDNRDSTGRCLGHETMTYQAYADHHITERAEPPKDECQTMRKPQTVCGCPNCCKSRYPADLVESDGGEA